MVFVRDQLKNQFQYFRPELGREKIDAGYFRSLFTLATRPRLTVSAPDANTR
jgi:hypothetical protein